MDCDLHYSRFRLVRLGLLSLVFTMLGLWVATGGVDAREARRGPGAWLGRLLGPDGLEWFGWAFAAATAALAFLYLRRAFGDPVAARAGAGGVTINTLLGSRFYAAGDIDRIELRRPAGQPILQIVPAAGRGKIRGLALNGLAEDGEAVEAWIDSAHAAIGGRAVGGR